MKKLNNYSFWILTPALLMCFFLFTGGIVSSTAEHFAAAAPTIHSFTYEPERITNNQQVTFTADVSANGSGQEYDSRDCKDYDVFEYTHMLKSNIEIFLDGQSVLSESFEKTERSEFRSEFVFNYTFLSPGTYEIVATFKTNWKSDKLLSDSERTSTERITLTVGDNGKSLPGNYSLTKFVAQCSSGPELEKTSGMGSRLTIGNTGRVTLNVDVAFSEEEREGRPCIREGYSFNGSGQIQLVTNSNGSQALQIQYQSNVYLEYGYSFDGKNLNLDYTDNDGNSFEFTFTKQ